MATKRWSVHLGNELAVLDEDHKLVAKARTAEEARLIAAAPDLRDSTLELLEIAQSNHSDCDWQSDADCRAEQYGDGNASEHLPLRDAYAKATQEVK